MVDHTVITDRHRCQMEREIQRTWSRSWRDTDCFDPRRASIFKLATRFTAKKRLRDLIHESEKLATIYHTCVYATGEPSWQDDGTAENCNPPRRKRQSAKLSKMVAQNERRTMWGKTPCRSTKRERMTIDENFNLQNFVKTLKLLGTFEIKNF